MLSNLTADQALHLQESSTNIFFGPGKLERRMSSSSTNVSARAANRTSPVIVPRTPPVVAHHARSVAALLPWRVSPAGKNQVPDSSAHVQLSLLSRKPRTSTINQGRRFIYHLTTSRNSDAESLAGEPNIGRSLSFRTITVRSLSPAASPSTSDHPACASHHRGNIAPFSS